MGPGFGLELELELEGLGLGCTSGVHWSQRPIGLRRHDGASLGRLLTEVLSSHAVHRLFLSLR